VPCQGTGYGFNVIAELKHSADTFEDQIVVSGNLAKALTQAVSTLVKPGPKGRLGTVSGAHVTDIEKGQILRDVTPQAVEKVSKQFMEILGVPQEYKKEADKALIESVKKEIISVRGKDVEIQRAQLAEVFMNYFGRKFTTRYGSKGVSISKEDLGMAQIPKTMGQLASDILGKIEKEGKAPKFGKLKDVPGMQKRLVESGNKFMISMFSDVTDKVATGLGVPDEIEEQARIYKRFTALIRKVYGEELPKDIEGITKLKKLYRKEVGGELYEEKPVDIRISARGAIKRGLQPEFIETMMGNVIGVGAGETTVKPRLEKDVYERILGTREQKGLLSKYSKALGFQAAGPSKKEIEAELFKTFKAQIPVGLSEEEQKKAEGEAKIKAERAAAFEAVANYYTTIKNEYGKAVKSIVGPKFVQIIEEPQETEKWSAKGVRELKKGAKINVAAYSAYASVFGEKSPLMEQIKKGTTLESKKQFEYIKALEAMAVSGPGKEMADALIQGLRKVPLKELQAFEPRTGTFSEEDLERSLKGTVLDIEKYASEFVVDLPTGKGPTGEIMRKPFYIPGPLARQTYPEELLAGEYGIEEISRYLQMVINTAKEVEALLSGEGPEVSKVKDIHNLIKTKVLEAVSKAQRGGPKEKGEVFKQFWEGLKDVQVEFAFRKEMGVPEGTTEKQYIAKFFEDWKTKYAQKPGKTSDDAMLLTIRRMGDILVGVQEGGRADLVATKPRLAKEVEAGTTADFAKRMGIDITDDKAITDKLNQLRKAKVTYMDALAQSLLGKGGAVQATFFERKAPAVLGKAITAVTDRTSELKEFGNTLRALSEKAGFEKYVEAFSNIATVIDDIGMEHAEIISRYKKEGVPVLKQEELGIPEAMARKMPVTFEKRYEMISGMPILTAKPKAAATVESNLYKMLEYKEELEEGIKKVAIQLDAKAIRSFIEKELVPHVETLRFPFTGVSSLQPYKAKVLKEEEYPKGKFAYAVPGVPEMRMATEEGKTGFVELIKKLEGIRDEFVKVREELHTTSEAAGMKADPSRVEELTNKIGMLDQAISDVLPKYTAIQQKLDFDGDEIEAHSGVLAEARQDIKKHFEVLNKSTNSIENAWRAVRGFEEAAPGATSSRFPFADLLTYFESKWEPEKGYEFLKRPEITEKLEFLKPAEKLDILTGAAPRIPADVLREIVEAQVTEPSKREEIFATIDKSINEGNDTSKELLEAIRALDSDFSKLIDAGVNESLYQKKYTDAIIGQLYKLHTGPETEAIYRMQRVAEARMGFGGGMIEPEAGGKYRTEAAGTFRKRWPTGLKMLGRISPESEISTFMNELSRFAQQKGMDVKLAGEKPVGGEITEFLGKGVKGVNTLLEKIGLAGDQADDDYKQLKEFADTSAKVIEKRLGTLPTEAIKKEISGLRKVRGMPEITMGTRKEAINEAVKLIGFEGFLRELSKQIEEDAVEALIAQLEAMPQGKREERMGGRKYMSTKEFAEEEIRTSPFIGMEAPGGIRTTKIMQQRMPLYSFRGFQATPKSIAETYRETAEGVKAPKVLEGYTATKYKEAQEVALSIARSLKEVGQMKPGGAYSDLVLSAIDNMYKEQEKKESNLNELRQEGYDIGLKREVLDIPARMFEEGMLDIPSFIRGLVDPSNDAAGSLQKLKKEIDELSLLAGIPPLSAEARRKIKFDIPELGAAARAKYPEITEESKVAKAEREAKISEFADLLIQKAQAVAQMDRAIAALVASKGFETKLLPPREDVRRALGEGIKATIKAPIGRPTIVETSTARKFREDIEKAGDSFFSDVEEAARSLPGGKGPGAGVSGGPLVGRPSDEIVRVHIQSVQEGIGLTFTPAGAMQDVIESKKAGAMSHLEELRELQKRAAGVSQTLEETYANVYRASALSGGGIYEGRGPKAQQQIESIKKYMTTGKRDVPPKAEAAAFEGTVIHKKEQDRLIKELETRSKGKEKYDVERYVKYTSSTAKDITGHVDLIKQRLDEDTKEYVDEKIIDIKTVSDKMVKRFKDLGIEKFSDLPELEKKGGLAKYDIQKLEEVASQLNIYIAAVAQANNVAAESLKGEAWFYDRDDIKNIAKISFKFDPGMLKRDMNAISEARKSIVSVYGKEAFAKAAHMIDLEKAEARRKSGAEPLSTKEWERFEKLSKEHRKMVEDPSSSFWREEEEKTRALPKEKLRADQATQRARFESYTIPETPVMGEKVYDQLENLRRVHTAAKEYQLRSKGINMETIGVDLHESLASIVEDVKQIGPQGQKFADTIEDLKFADIIGGGDIGKAWKYYRVALGDFFIKQAEEAKKLESELQLQGELGGAREAYNQAERTINEMKKRISQSLGKPSDIYTEMRRYVSPDIMQQLGLYLTPEQLLTKSKGALGGDEKLDVMFKETVVGDVLKGGKLTAPIEKVREVLKGISDLDEEMIKTLTDADKFKRAGSEIQEAWNFEKLTDRVTKLRSSLETFLKFRLQEDADVVGRKNLEDTLKLLKNLENQYSSFGRVQREGPAGWGEMGITKVPRFIEPRQQFAMHQRNIQKVREYFKKTEEEGGPEPGERYTYMFKVIGEAGDTIKNVAFDFRKYGDALNFAGERVGVFKEAQRDMFMFMQEGGRTFRSAIMRAIRWGAASRIVYGGWQKLGQSINLLADIETGMANLRMIMSPLETDFGTMSQSAIGFAKQYGVPMTDVLKSMKIFAQQGLQQGEVIDRTQTATLASNVTTLSAAEATEALTAAMKVFRQEGESSMKFMDAWSEVEAKHAITSGDMANALKKAASAGKNAGFTFDELNGVVAAIGSVTRQTGKEVGTAMRFIFRRLTSEKGPKELAKIGIPVLTETGELRKGFDVLNELSLSWKDLTNAQRMNIAQSIGGTRQYNALLVLMDNWNEALSAIEDSTNSKGSAERRNLEIMKTFTKQLQQVKAAATEVYMSFGKITFPIAKVGLKGLKFLLESFAEVPGVVKAAMVSMAGFFIYMSKGADIIDYFFERWRGGKSIIGEVMKGMGKEWTVGISELFGIGDLEQNLKTIGKGKKIKIPMGVFDVSPEGVAQERIVEKLIPQGKKLKDFHSVLGKTIFLLKQTGMTYNEFIGNMVKGGGDLIKDVGGPFDFLSKKLFAFRDMIKGGFDILGPEALVGILATEGPVGIINAIPAILAGVGMVATDAAGKTTKVVAKAAQFAGDKFGKAGKSFVEGFASEHTGMIKALAPLGVSIAVLYPSLKALSEYYMKTTRSAQDYEKSMYGVRRATESQLKGIRELISGYTGLEGSMADVVKVSDPDVKKRRQELGTFESPLLTISSIIKKSRDLSNNLADSNVNLVVGYDKFGNAILNITGNLKDYLKVLENIKVKEAARVEIDIAAKFITDLTEIEGPEKWKYALKNLLKEAPAFGEVLAKGIKLSPAKAMDVVTERLNDMLAIKKKFPMSTAFDKDIKKQQDNLKKVRSGFRATYSDFRRVLSDIETRGLSKGDIARLLGTEELRKGYELMIEVEPRFNLKETKGKVEWQDVLGAEVMRRAFPSFAATFDATSVLTKARLETAGAVKREGKAMSGDVAFFMDDAADKYGMAGSQAVVSLKETTDGVFNWFVTYFNSKTLRIEERPFTEDLQNMVESIFPKNRIEEELSERIESLNEFVAGAAAGLRGLSVKDFKKDFGLGERFFSEIPTTTILQGPKGFVPGARAGAGTFGVSPFQKEWKETTQEFFFKPMREYRLKAEQLEKLRLEGLQGGEVTLARGLYEELTKLQNVLKNNQVVLQYRAVFVDLTKTLEEGTRALKENLAVEQSRLKLRKGVVGYQKGISEGLDAIDLGVQRFSDLTVKQRALTAGPDYGRAAVRFREY
jgi:TP901 family phage tail tape measure protein